MTIRSNPRRRKRRNPALSIARTALEDFMYSGIDDIASFRRGLAAFAASDKFWDGLVSLEHDIRRLSQLKPKTAARGGKEK